MPSDCTYKIFLCARACVCFTVILIFKKMLAGLNFLPVELSEQRSERSPGSLRLSRSACVFQQHLVAKGAQSVTASPSHEGQGAAPRRGNRSLLPLVIMAHFLRSIFDDMNHRVSSNLKTTLEGAAPEAS